MEKKTMKKSWAEIAWEYDTRGDGACGACDGLALEVPHWLTNKFIDENCADIDDDEELLDNEELTVEEQLESFYEPLYYAAKNRLGRKANELNRETFYAWMQKILDAKR